jgi:outer membrane protein OmpA-like peptidoglycan-associated protein
VTALFTPEEAVVIRQPGRLTLRLKGISFERGDAVVMPESYALLAKVIRAIDELPGASITVQGHTDSQGDAERNLVLSQQRAEAVRAFLEANTDLSDRLVNTVGLGETTPVASNDTAEGRALNRRIDVVFDAPSLIGD